MLADIKNVVDVQGLTITKGKDTGTILLDASGNENNKSNKAQDVKVAGHEAGEIKYLQNGNGLIFKDSYDTKEAMNDSSGNSFYNRLNEAANGNLTDVTYDSKSNDNVNAGTIYSNNVQTQENGIEYRKLVPEDHLFIKNNTKKYAEIYNISEKDAKQRLVLGSRTLVDTQDNIMINKIINKTKTNTIMTKNELTQTQGFIMKESLGLTYMDGIDNSKVPLMTQSQAKEDDYSYVPNIQDAINPDIIGAGAFLKIGKVAPSVFNSSKTILNKGIVTYDAAGRQTSIFINSTVKPSVFSGLKHNKDTVVAIKNFTKEIYNRPNTVSNISFVDDAFNSALPHGAPSSSYGGLFGFGTIQYLDSKDIIHEFFNNQYNSIFKKDEK